MKHLMQRARLIALTAIALATTSTISVSATVPQGSQCAGCIGISYGLDTDSSQAGTISISAHPSDGFCDAGTCQKFSCEYDTITTWSLSPTIDYSYTECSRTGRKWACTVGGQCCVTGLGQMSSAGALPCGQQIQILFSAAGLSVTTAGDCTACQDTQ